MRRGLVVLVVVASAIPVSAASVIGASTITSANFSGGASTALVAGTLFARTGAALTLSVDTDASASCVSLSGAHSGSSTTPISSDGTTETWTFALTAVIGPDGPKSTTVAASADAGCAVDPQTATATYVVDNTGPTVSAAIPQTANSAGWYNVDISITWSAVDAGSGVATGPTPATDSQTVDVSSVTKQSTATDRLGNIGTGSVTVKLDKTAPGLVGVRNPPANVNGWNNTNVTVTFTCSDGRSGVRVCPGSTTFTSNVAGASVAGTAIDFASNSTTVTVGPINIDKDAPTISGAPQGSPNGAGWYNADVTVAWTCNDTGGSGFAAGACADSTLSTEGTGLTLTRTVTDLAGNTSSPATSTPAVNIDKTAPSVSVAVSPDANSAGWHNSMATATFTCGDTLSGMASCPADVVVTSEGAGQTVSGSAVDHAGNSAPASTTVSMDVTPPSVVVTGVVDGGTYDEGGYSAGCATSDGLSGVATDATLATSGGATGPVTLTCAGASDVAGNSQAAPVSVTITVASPPPPSEFDFGGFLRPLEPAGALNSVNGGSAVPIRFSLGGYFGMDILESYSPASAAYPCSATPPTAGLTPTAAANDKLTYDAESDTYTYVWKTKKRWTDCRVLELRFVDGSVEQALFEFR